MFLSLFVFSLSRDRTHIDRSLFCQVELSLVDFESPSLRFFYVQSHFSSTVSFRVTVLGIHIHWHCTSNLHGFALVLILLTSLPCAYRLFIIVLPYFPFHYT